MNNTARSLRNESPGPRLSRRFRPGVSHASIHWTPSIVPRGDDHDVYLVVDDLGRLGWIWRKADYEATDWETVVTDMLQGQYNTPIGVFAFNTAEGWSRDVSADIAAELRRRCDLQLTDCRRTCRTSSIDTTPWTGRNCRCRCAWHEPPVLE